MSAISRNLVLMLLLVFAWPVVGNAQIFKCVSQTGELTFSQTPCQDSKVTVYTSFERRNVETSGREHAHRPAPATAREMNFDADRSVKESRSTQQAVRRARRAKEVEDREKCRDRIRSQIDRINSRMRAGYSASQGIRMRERRRDLEKRMREC